LLVAVSVVLCGCLEKSGTESKSISLSQDSLCLFSEFGDAKTKCKNGQVAVFAPSRWGNEQLPIYAASNFCDYRYTIVQNSGGVSCIFIDARLKENPKDNKSATSEEKTK
jgi:hypothetical protein